MSNRSNEAGQRDNQKCQPRNRVRKWMRGIIPALMLFSTVSVVGQVTYADSDASPSSQKTPNFTATVVPLYSTLKGKSKLNVVVTVTQHGDLEEGHALPKQVQFEFHDVNQKSYPVVGNLLNPVSSRGRIGYKYVGVYSVTVPNPDATLTNVNLRADSFYMLDSNHGAKGDDGVPTTSAVGPITINPVLPDFVANIQPSTTNLVGNSELTITVTARQNGDTDEGHALPKQITFEFIDSAGKSHIAVGKLVSPVSSQGGVGYQYIGSYKVTVPNVASQLTGTKFQADGFDMVDLNNGSRHDDHVAASQYQGTLTINPAPPNFVATISPSSTNLTGRGSVNVTVSVTQNGDTEEGHELPHKIQFEFLDSNHQWKTVTGNIVNPIKAQGGIGYQYVGVYGLSVPNPDSTKTNIVLKADPFHMLDSNRGSESDDRVAATASATTLTVTPAPPNFAATLNPTKTSVEAKSSLIVVLTVTQSGDTDEGHALPSQLRFEFFDANHQWVQTGKLLRKVSARGGMGYQYVGAYSIPVPDPGMTLNAVNLRVDGFKMSDWNHGSTDDDDVSASNSSVSIAMTPKSSH